MYKPLGGGGDGAAANQIKMIENTNGERSTTKDNELWCVKQDICMLKCLLNGMKKK